MKPMKKAVVSCVLTGVLSLGLSFGMAPAPKAEAGILTDVIGTAIGGTLMRDQIMSQYKQINNTDEGRQAWFEKMKEKEGVVDDWSLNNRLDTIMDNVITGIRAVDSTVDKKPYN